MSQEKVLITGCGGMLGSSVYPACVAKYGSANVLATDIDLNESWLSYLDVRDLAACEKVFNEFNPTLVLHLAALTDLEYCEKNPHNTWNTNALGAENIALLAKKRDIPMVHISTAGVFNGKKEEYTDFDFPDPINYYGGSKYYAEKFIQQHLSKYFVFRAGWMMGGGLKKDKKFINKVYKQIKSGAKELFVVDDKLGTPTYTKNFADAILKVVDTNHYGLYNQVCTGGCSRLDVAKEFVKLLDMEDKIKVTTVSSDHWKSEYFAPRPPSEKLINLKLNTRKINHMKHWKECLEEYSQIFKEDLHGKV